MVLSAARSSALRALALAVLGVGFGAAEAAAVEPPDPERLAAIRTVCERAEGVRLHTPRGIYDLRRPAVSAEGIALKPGKERAAVVEVGDVAKPVELVAWSDIDRVDVGDYHHGRATLAGFLLGAAAGAILVAATDDDDMVVYGALLAVGGAGAGYLYGGRHPYWNRLYP